MRYKIAATLESRYEEDKLIRILQALEKKGWVTYDHLRVEHIHAIGRRPQIMPRVIGYLKKHGPSSYRGIIQTLKLKEGSARAALKRMGREGLVTFTSGVWDKRIITATPKGVRQMEAYWKAFEDIPARAEMIAAQLPHMGEYVKPEQFPELSPLAFKLAMRHLEKDDRVAVAHVEGDATYYLNMLSSET